MILKRKLHLGLLVLSVLFLTACSSDFEQSYVKDTNSEQSPLTTYTYKPTESVTKQIELKKHRILVSFYKPRVHKEDAILAVTNYMNKHGYDILSVSHDEPYSSGESVLLIYEKVDYLDD